MNISTINWDFIDTSGDEESNTRGGRAVFRFPILLNEHTGHSIAQELQSYLKWIVNYIYL